MRSRRAVVVKMIEDHRKELGITPRKISDEEIVQRLVYALVNEGAQILEEGIASKASDIDMVYLTGYGFPLYRGGPMCYADQQGLFNVVQAMKRFAPEPARRRQVLAAGAAAGEAGGRGQELQLSSVDRRGRGLAGVQRWTTSAPASPACRTARGPTGR